MGCAGAIDERYRHLVADGAVRTDIVVVSTPMLHLPPGVVKGQEPVGVQALRPELTVEGVNAGAKPGHRGGEKAGQSRRGGGRSRSALSNCAVASERPSEFSG